MMAQLPPRITPTLRESCLKKMQKFREEASFIHDTLSTLQLIPVVGKKGSIVSLRKQLKAHLGIDLNTKWAPSSSSLVHELNGYEVENEDSDSFGQQIRLVSDLIDSTPAPYNIDMGQEQQSEQQWLQQQILDRNQHILDRNQQILDRNQQQQQQQIQGQQHQQMLQEKELVEVNQDDSIYSI